MPSQKHRLAEKQVGENDQRLSLAASMLLLAGVSGLVRQFFSRRVDHLHWDQVDENRSESQLHGRPRDRLWPLWSKTRVMPETCWDLLSQPSCISTVAGKSVLFRKPRWVEYTTHPYGPGVHYKHISWLFDMSQKLVQHGTAQELDTQSLQGINLQVSIAFPEIPNFFSSSPAASRLEELSEVAIRANLAPERPSMATSPRDGILLSASGFIMFYHVSSPYLFGSAS